MLLNSTAPVLSTHLDGNLRLLRYAVDQMLASWGQRLTYSACALAYGSAALRAKTACGKVAQLRPKKNFARAGRTFTATAHARRYAQT